MTGFADLGLPPAILAALGSIEYEEPTPVQRLAIPPLLDGRDAVVEAQTGSGKTTAFGVPSVVVGSRGPGLRVLVLVPTRELARQVSEELRALGAGSPFRCVAVTGGIAEEKQERTIAGDVRCIVATPGRLLALLEERKLRLDRVELVVLDEADRMLDMGFRTDIERVLEATRSRSQTALFSATLPEAVVSLARRHLREPQSIHASPTRLPTTLEHFRLNVFEESKTRALVALLQQEKPERAIVFVRTRTRASALAKVLKQVGLQADPLQGDMSHEQRRHVFDLFSRGVTRILVATDIASRGLDVPEMQLVVNVDLPDEPGAYTHRAGRAARFGREGRVVTFVLPSEKDDRQRLERESGGEWAPYKLPLATIEAVELPGDKPKPRPQARKGSGGKPSGQPGGKHAPKPKTPRPPERATRSAPTTRREETRTPRTPRPPKQRAPPPPDVPPSRKGRKRD